MNAPDVALAAPRQHLPRGEEFLFLPPWIQPYAYRNVDRLFANRPIRRGPQPRAQAVPVHALRPLRANRP